MESLRRISVGLVSLGLALGLVGMSYADRYVPSEYVKVQDAINAAGSGETVYVAAGTYAPSTNGEAFPINMKNGVSLVGAGAGLCMLDAEGTNEGIRCVGISDTTTRIEGFTITGGNGGYGGGISCWDDSSPTITNNTITGNSARDGGGIGCYLQSNPTITNNTITGNSASRYGGGGIYCGYESSPTITNNTITGNSASRYGGGGIYCGYESSPTITNNTITGNSAGDYGGGICCYHRANATITNNTITGNSSGRWGGGIFCYYYSEPTITNNTITGNSARDGGGICCSDWSNPTITNNTITGNSASRYGGGIYCVDSSFPSITYDDVWGNTGGDYYDCSPGTGCISADPLYVDPANDDYHLQPGSPCIDAGDNSAPAIPPTDFDGNPRILDGDGDAIAIVDMGAFELQITAVSIDKAFLTPKKVNLKRKARHSFKIHIYPSEAMDVSVGDSAEVYVDVGGSETFEEGEGYLAVVSSTDVDGEALDIAIKVYCDDLVDNDPGVAIYSINDIDIVYADELGGGDIDDLVLDTFTPPRKAGKGKATAPGQNK